MGIFVWANVSIASSLLGVVAESVAWLGQSVHQIDLLHSFEKPHFPFSFQSADNLNPAALTLPLILMFWSFATIFYYAEFGNMVMNKFQTLNDQSTQCRWYRFPRTMQNMFLIYLVDAQQPVFIRGYGNIYCTRDAFKEVSNLNFTQNVSWFSTFLLLLSFPFCLDCEFRLFIFHDAQ